MAELNRLFDNLEFEEEEVKPKKKSKVKPEMLDVLHEIVESGKEKEKKKITDEYRYMTFILKHPIADRLDSLCEGKKKGYKTRLINRVMAEFLLKVEMGEITDI